MYGRVFPRVVVGLVVYALLLVTGCASGTGGEQQTPLAISVAVTPANATLSAGATQTFSATVTNDTTNGE